jgi:hypothetical protein
MAGGYVDMPVFKGQYLTNKDLLKYYYKDIGFIEEQFIYESTQTVKLRSKP